MFGLGEARFPVNFGKKERTLGGYGSGANRRKPGKPLVEEQLVLDIRWWQRNGVIAPGWIFSPPWAKRDLLNRATVEILPGPLACIHWQPHVIPGTKDPEASVVKLAITPCRFGGVRYWFQCPEPKCGQRIALLFHLEGRWACRRCLALAYRSQRERDADRALSRAQAIRKRLGGSPSLLAPFPAKPKGMHWRTYIKLRKTASDAQSVYLVQQMAELGNMGLNLGTRQANADKGPS